MSSRLLFNYWCFYIQISFHFYKVKPWKSNVHELKFSSRVIRSLMPLYAGMCRIHFHLCKCHDNLWSILFYFAGVGVGMLISMTIFCIYYNVIMAWSLYYIASSFAVPLPWTSCNNEWNSEYCTDDRSTLNLTSQVLQGINSTNSTPNWITAQEEFWQ